MQVPMVVPSHICNPGSQQRVVDHFGDGGKRLALLSCDIGRDRGAHAIPDQPWAEGVLAIYGEMVRAHHHEYSVSPVAAVVFICQRLPGA
ncbi:hypothetical protein D3C76_1232930 [compost metagenome]